MWSNVHFKSITLNDTLDWRAPGTETVQHSSNAYGEMQTCSFLGRNSKELDTKHEGEVSIKITAMGREK